MVPTVPLPHVFEHLVTPIVGEVHVDVRHGDTLRVEESFKEEVVFDRVDVGDAGEVGDE